MSIIGWGAVPVRGFIPPWAFMEFQALGILPIACDMRSRQHLTYTPAPDIVHESAGHSPIIINEEYSNYLKLYGKIASKAVFSKEDENIYFAIRKLSDIKEDKNASKKDIIVAEEELLEAKKSQTTPSEATLLSRLHWWTVEYGSINSMDKEICELYNMFFNKKIEAENLKKKLDADFPNEWLLRFELYQNNHHLNYDWVENLKSYLINYNKDNLDLNNAINRALKLI